MFIPIRGTAKSERSFRTRLRDLALYITITMAILGIVGSLASTNLSWNTIMKLICFVGFTVLLFGYFIVDSRSWWRRGSYWGLTAFFLLVHSTIYAVVFNHVEVIKPVWVGLIVVPEMLAFVVCRNWLVTHTSNAKTTRRSTHNEEKGDQ